MYLIAWQKRRNMNQKVEQKKISRLKQPNSFPSNLCVTGGPGEKRENGITAIFEKIIDNNFQN